MDKKSGGVLAGVIVIAAIAGVSMWDELSATSAELAATRTRLSSTEMDIASAKLEAALAQLEVTTIQSQLDSSQAESSKLKSQYEADKTWWQTQSAQSAKQYSDLRDQIILRLGDDKRVQQFVTPNESSVSATVKAAVGSYKDDVNQRWRDFQGLYQWVIDNVKYSYDSGLPILPSSTSGTLSWADDFWRFPSETIADKTGDCEDMATLLASMLLNYNGGKYGIWVLIIDSGDPKVPGHVAAAFPVQGKKLTIVDPAGNYYTGRSSWSGVAAEDVATATNSWLGYWAKEIPNGHISKAFSDTIYREFKTNQEFIDWASAGN